MLDVQLHDPAQLKILNRTMHRIRALLRVCTASLLGLVGAAWCGDFVIAPHVAFVVWGLLVLLAWNRNELSQPE